MTHLIGESLIGLQIRYDENDCTSINRGCTNLMIKRIKNSNYQFHIQ